jgi:hypothetical protein
MTWGNNGAGPLGVPPIGPPTSVNSPMVGQQGVAYPAFYNASFESIMAAVSRGEISLNQTYRVAGLGGVGNANGNPTLLQAISQGVPQNATNGIGVVSGPGVGAGNGVGISAVVSGTGGLGAAVSTGSGNSSTNFGGSQLLDPKQMASDPSAALANPIQYGGN